MRHLLVNTALALLVFTACSPKIVYVPVEHTEYVTVRDTTILHKTDTLVQVPDVSISDYINVSDTLRMTASNSEARAWVDTTTNTLKGTLKQGGKLPVQIVEKERVVYRDSISYQEKPVPVEVEKIVKKVPLYAKVLSFFGVLFLIAAAWFAAKKYYFKR